MGQAMWNNFDGHPYTREAFKARVDLLEWKTWKPSFIMQHATGSPTLSQWVNGGSAAQRIKNLQRFYEVEKHWQHGPHLFIAPDFIWGFSNLLERGTHCSCCNGSSIGIECVGYYSPGHDAWDTGDGAKVRDNFVFAAAVLHNKLGLRPDPLVPWQSGLHQHSMCKADGHSICPGPLVDRNDVARRISAKMAELRGVAPSMLQAGAPVIHGPAWLQASLNRLDADPMLAIDGDLGPLTKAALFAWQFKANLKPTGNDDPATIAAIERALAAVSA